MGSYGYLYIMRFGVHDWWRWHQWHHLGAASGHDIWRVRSSDRVTKQGPRSFAAAVDCDGGHVGELGHHQTSPPVWRTDRGTGGAPYDSSAAVTASMTQSALVIWFSHFRHCQQRMGSTQTVGCQVNSGFLVPGWVVNGCWLSWDDHHDPMSFNKGGLYFHKPPISIVGGRSQAICGYTDESSSYMMIYHYPQTIYAYKQLLFMDHKPYWWWYVRSWISHYQTS